jgi:hypothetical protein
MKALVRNLSFLLLIIIAAHEFLSAQSCSDSVSSLKEESCTSAAIFGSNHSTHMLVIKPLTNETGKSGSETVIEENKLEEEVVSSRKNSRNTDSFVAVFCALTFGYLVHYLIKRVRFREPFIYFNPNSWYITLRVIRI